MTRRPVRDMTHSVRERLANLARRTGRPFQEILTYYALERFLYRLGVSPYADRLVLKGALMFVAWHAPPGRSTRDADFLGRGDSSVEALVRMMRDICEVPVEPDGLRFDSAGVVGDRIREGADYEGVRIRFVAHLGQARITMQVDVGFGDVVVPAPELIEYPVLLPDLPAPHLRGYTRESTVAEKFEAMVSLGAINTRYKDFYDVWFLAQHFDFEGRTLARAVTATFQRRGTPLTAGPVAWSDEFVNEPARQRQWEAFVRRAGVVDAPRWFGDVPAVARALLKPVAEACLSGETSEQAWRAPGPWSPSTHSDHAG